MEAPAIAPWETEGLCAAQKPSDKRQALAVLLGFIAAAQPFDVGSVSSFFLRFA